jgi:hypothetical protein
VIATAVFYVECCSLVASGCNNLMRVLVLYRVRPANNDMSGVVRKAYDQSYNYRKVK